MKRMLFVAVVIFIIYISLGIIGCGEEEVIEPPAKIVRTDPVDGGQMFDNERLVIDFDKFVAKVEVNGTSAEVTGPRAIWKVQGVEPGRQILMIQWTDEYENNGSGEITILIMDSSDIVC